MAIKPKFTAVRQTPRLSMPPSDGEAMQNCCACPLNGDPCCCGDPQCDGSSQVRDDFSDN